MGEYAGVGPGAHSRLIASGGARIGLSTERHPETWRALVRSQGAGVTEETPLSGPESAEEYLLMGLRLSEGIDLTRHARLGGRSLPPEKLGFLADQGLIAVEAGRLTATAQGRRVLNALVAELCA
jgi:oxygen-independent coproporphyrinogen-3 oxidase